MSAFVGLDSKVIINSHISEICCDDIAVEHVKERGLTSLPEQVRVDNLRKRQRTHIGLMRSMIDKIAVHLFCRES